ncbi:hypothetical protein [Candidatus Igneacidithiobacillus taiwanensis]|uniref:hypothetical protein n=1 Tax=Candidatus Igneacidithiobacillus taiwanensis TaxID=1945924 RepID=UPI00289B20DC|nr:hypothetical protein [Candidatus Igneacidithiobacillus taiwanensis]
MLTAKTQKWIDENIESIRGKKNKTTFQKLLISLLALENRTRDDERQINAIVRKMIADEAAHRAAEKAKATTAKMSTKRRKERNHRLFDLAGLFILAGLVDSETGFFCHPKLAGLGERASPAVLGYLHRFNDQLESFSDGQIQFFVDRGLSVMSTKKKLLDDSKG